MQVSAKCNAFRTKATREVSATLMRLRGEIQGIPPADSSAMVAEVMIAIAAIHAFHAKGKPAFTEDKFAAACQAALVAIETVCDEFDHRN